MTTYYFYWLDGKKEKGEGNSVADAFRNLGYGGGAINALDFYSTNDTHQWNTEKKEWVKKDS